jgi:hypothetical protein
MDCFPTYDWLVCLIVKDSLLMRSRLPSILWQSNLWQSSTKISKRKTVQRRSLSKRKRQRQQADEEEHEEVEHTEEDEEEEEYEVEAILAKKGVKYHIKWKGFTDTTWEVRENLSHCEDLVSEFEASQAGKQRARPLKATRRSGQDPDSSPPRQNTTRTEELTDQVKEAVRQGREGGSNETTIDHSDQGASSPSNREVVSSGRSMWFPANQRWISYTSDGSDEDSAECKTNDDEATGNVSAATLPLASVPPKTPPTPRIRQNAAKAAAGGLERALIGKLVAYSPKADKWLSNNVYEVVGSTFIVGRVCLYHFVKKKGLYEIRWLDSMFQNRVEKVDLAVVKQGLQNYEHLQEKMAGRSDTPR